MLKIRFLQKQDIQPLLRLMRSFPDDYSKIYLNSKKQGSIQWLFNYSLQNKDKKEIACFVLLEDNIVVGHGGYLRDVRCFEGGVYELRALVVDKKYQNGCRLLVDKIESKIKKLKGRIIWFQTSSTEKSKKNNNFKKWGYELLAVYPDYWGDNRDRLVYTKKL